MKRLICIAFLAFSGATIATIEPASAFTDGPDTGWTYEESFLCSGFNAIQNAEGVQHFIDWFGFYSPNPSNCLFSDEPFNGGISW
jgi:hypothetical protein